MKFTITRKNTNDKFIVSSINDSKKSSKLSRAKISDAEIYKCRIIRFLDAIAATNESLCFLSCSKYFSCASFSVFAVATLFLFAPVLIASNARISIECP